MKKFVCTILVMCIMMSMTVAVSAYYGVGYSFDKETGSITVYAEGEMPNYGVTEIAPFVYRYTLAPWNDIDDDIIHAKLDERISSIGDMAFLSCKNMVSIEMGDKVERFGEMSFDSCYSLEIMEYPENLREICDRAFYCCKKLSNGNLPKSVEFIGEYAFYDCISLTEINIPEGTKTIANCAFGKTGLKSVIIPSSVQTMDYSAFHYCSALESVVVHANIKEIANGIFQGCESLKKVELPCGITAIADKAFEGCAALSDVYFVGSEAEWDRISIGRDNEHLKNATIHFNSTMPVNESNEADNGNAELAIAHSQCLLVDNQGYEIDAYSIVDNNGGITNYVKLRDIAFILNGSDSQFEVEWNGAVNILTGVEYNCNGSEFNTPFSGDMEYTEAKAETTVDGKVVNIEAILLTDDEGGGYTYYKLRDLGEVIGFSVGWTNELGVYIETKTSN